MEDKKRPCGKKVKNKEGETIFICGDISGNVFEGTTTKVCVDCYVEEQYV